MRILLAAMGLVLSMACSQSDAKRYSEDQRLDGPFQITSEWHTIKFKRPLELNHRTIQRLHFVVDGRLYIANGEHDLGDKVNHSNLRRADGKLIVPEVILTTDDGEEVRVYAAANIYLYAGGVTIGFDAREEKNMVPRTSPYPQHVKSFISARVRSNEPFEVEYAEWSVDREIAR